MALSVPGFGITPANSGNTTTRAVTYNGLSGETLIGLLGCGGASGRTFADHSADGWVDIFGGTITNASAGDNLFMQILRRKLTGDEATYTFSINSATQNWGAAIIRIGGNVDVTTPVDVATSSNSNTLTASPVCPDATIVTAGALVLRLLIRFSTQTSVDTPYPSSTTGLFVRPGNALTTECTHAAAYHIAASTGAIGTSTWTNLGSSTRRANRATLAIRPAAGGTDVTASPSAGSIALSGGTSVVAASKTAAPSAGSIALAGQAPTVTIAVYTFSDEFNTLSLDTALNGSANWAWKFAGWNVTSLDDNGDRARKTHANYNPGGAAQTPAQMGIVLHEISAQNTLKLYARINPDPANWGGYGWLGGMISSELSQAHEYGTWECRAKLFVSTGHHWSIWMVPANYFLGGNAAWPEIDLVEIVSGSGNTLRLFMNDHANPSGNKTYYNNTIAESNAIPAYLAVADTAAWQGWHVYKFVWTPDIMEWWIDGLIRMSCPNYFPAGHPMHFMITPEVIGVNQAGTWPAQMVDETTVWPMEAEVDYVRYTAYGNLFSERVLPVSRQASTNLKDSANASSPPTLISDIDEDPTSADGLWWTAVDSTLDTAARIRMATPSGTLAGTQSLRALLRKTSGVGNPSTTLRLWQNGVQKTPTTTVEVGSTSGAVQSLIFGPEELSGNTNVELAISATAAAPASFSDDWNAADGPWDATKWPTVTVGTVTGNTSAASIVSNRGRMQAKGTSSSFHWVRAIASATGLTDFEITLKFTLKFAGEQYHSIFYRSSVASTGGLNPINSYQVQIENGNLTWRYIKSSTAGGAVSVAKAWGVDSEWNMRISCVGNDHKVRVWQGTEPGTWDIEQTDSSTPITSGGLRLSALNSGTGSSERTVDWDDLSLSSGGTASTIEIGAVDLLAQVEISGSTTVSPAAGSVAITGSTSTVTAAAAVALAAGHLTLVGSAPLVDNLLRSRLRAMNVAFSGNLSFSGSPAVDTIDEGCDNPGNDWAAAIDGTAEVTLTVTFPDPE